MFPVCHKISRVPVPPAVLIVAVPSLLIQLASVEVKLVVIAAGEDIETPIVLVHADASFTVTV